MTPDRESKLKLYSLAIVLEDKPRGTDEIKVSPVEDMPFVNGKIIDYKQQYSVSLPDENNIPRRTDTTGDATVIAKWMPWGDGNRNTSPDVRKNETVLLFRYADTDEYHWVELFREPSLRRLETVCYMYGDIPSGVSPYDKQSSYWCEFSTHDKKIQIHTSQSNGEQYTYDVIIDPGNSRIIVKDNVGQTIALDSPAGRVSAQATKEIILKAPVIYLDGEVVITEGLATGGSVTSGDAISAKGPVSTNGPISSNGPISTGGHVNSKGPIMSDSHIAASGPITTSSHVAAEGPITSSKSISSVGPIMSNQHISAAGPVVSGDYILPTWSIDPDEYVTASQFSSGSYVAKNPSGMSGRYVPAAGVISTNESTSTDKYDSSRDNEIRSNISTSSYGRYHDTNYNVGMGHVSESTTIPEANTTATAPPAVVHSTVPAPTTNVVVPDISVNIDVPPIDHYNI